MKRIIKLLSAALLAVMIVPAFASCHGTVALPEYTLPSSFDETKEIEITFWAKNDTNVTQVKTYVKAAEDFSKLYPNVKVNIRLYTDYAKLYQDVITNLATKTTPNVCITYPDHIATYLTGTNVVVPLDAIMTDAKFGLGGSELRFDGVKKDEIVAKFLDELKLDGKCYGLPFMRSTEALYINKDYVEKLGYTVPDTVTWDWIWDVSEKAAEKDENGTYKVNGQKIMIPFIYKSTDNMMIQMLRQKNAGYSKDDGTIEIFNDTTRSLLLDLAGHCKAGAFSTFKISSYPANFLNAGQCIFAVDSTAGATWMGSGAPLCDIAEDSIVDFETVVRAVPQFDTSNPQMISQGPSICIFNKDDEQVVLASWLFAQYLLTTDIQLAYAETEGYVPVTTKAQNDPAYIEYLSTKDTGADSDHYYVKIEATKLLLDNIDNTFITPVFNGSASLREAAGDMIERVTKSVRRKETVDGKYIDSLFADIPVKYHLNDISRAE